MQASHTYLKPRNKKLNIHGEFLHHNHKNRMQMLRLVLFTMFAVNSDLTRTLIANLYFDDYEM